MMRDNAYISHHQQVLCRIVAHHAIIIEDEYTSLSTRGDYLWPLPGFTLADYICSRPWPIWIAQLHWV